MTLADFSTTFTREFTPGPGAYETDHVKRLGGEYSVKCAIRPKYPSKPPLTCNIDFPPNSTSLNLKKRSIGRKTSSRQEDYVPGPNYYPDPNEHLRKSVAIKKRYKDPDMSIYPGPGHYSPQDQGKTRVPPQGARPKIVLSEVPDSPGPAAYDVPRVCGDGTPKTAIRPKTAPPGSRDVDPGFTYNNPGDVKIGTPRWTIPRAKPPLDIENDNPGPGEYDPIDGTETRIAPYIRPKTASKEVIVEDVPYENTRRFPGNNGYTIGVKSGKGYWAFDEQVPGPKFMPDSTLDRKSLTIGEKRPGKKIEESPGPSDYNPAYQYKRNASSFSFKGPPTRDDWLPHDKWVPGPGQYDTISRGNSKPKWIMGERSITRSQKSRASNRELPTRANSTRSLNSSRRAKSSSRSIRAE